MISYFHQNGFISLSFGKDRQSSCIRRARIPRLSDFVKSSLFTISSCSFAISLFSAFCFPVSSVSWPLPLPRTTKMTRRTRRTRIRRILDSEKNGMPFPFNPRIPPRSSTRSFDSVNSQENLIKRREGRLYQGCKMSTVLAVQGQRPKCSRRKDKIRRHRPHSHHPYT